MKRTFAFSLFFFLVLSSFSVTDGFAQARTNLPAALTACSEATHTITNLQAQAVAFEACLRQAGFVGDWDDHDDLNGTDPGDHVCNIIDADPTDQWLKGQHIIGADPTDSWLKGQAGVIGSEPTDSWLKENDCGVMIGMGQKDA